MGSARSNERVTERDEESDVDELKELEMRTGLVNRKVSKMRMPSLKVPGGEYKARKKMTTKKLTFAGDVTMMSSFKDGKSVAAPSVIILYLLANIITSSRYSG